MFYAYNIYVMYNVDAMNKAREHLTSRFGVMNLIYTIV